MLFYFDSCLKVAKIRTLNIVKKKVNYLEIGFVNKTGLLIERENTLIQ